MSAASTSAIWIPRPRPDAQMALFCFPYAGAGASVFRDWVDALPPSVQLCPVQLPGREWRRQEPPHIRMEALLDQLMTEMVQAMNAFPSIVFFGYSMGAAIAFALARHLRDAGERLPDKLVLAACRAPHLLAQSAPIHQLGDDDFLRSLQRLGGIPDLVLEDPELLKMVMSVLRADFEVLATYQHRQEAALPMPFVVYGGSNDPIASRSELAGWRPHTTGGFTARIFSGGHFFVNEVRGQVQRTLVNDTAEFWGTRREPVRPDPHRVVTG